MGKPGKRFPAAVMGLPRPKLKWDGVSGWTPAQPTAQDLAFADGLGDRRSDMTQPMQRDLTGVGDLSGALCEISRQLALRLDRLTDVMSQFPAHMLQVLESAGQLDVRELTHYIKMSLASVPTTHETVKVAGGTDASGAAVAITPVIKNTTDDSVPMMMTNDDNAQMLMWGSSTLTQTNGAILSSEKTVIIVVPPNSYVYAVFPLYTRTVSISRLGIP